MAIELCSDDSSPRISFSQDISQTDTVQIPSTNSSSSNIDFDFCVFHDLQSSSADELFLDGKILPIEMKRKIPPSLPPNNKSNQKPLNKSHKLVIPSYNASFKNESLSTSDEKQSSKSFWKFKRSNSTCSSSSSYARTLCPLPILSRSNSTGSTASMKHKHHFQKSSSSVSSSNGYYQKPPLRKVPGYINGIKISPVLNVTPANFFGFSSIFSSSKEKNKKK